MNGSNEIRRGDIVAALAGQRVLSAEVSTATGDPDEGYIVIETTGGVRLYADSPTAYRVVARAHPGIAAIEARLAEAQAEYAQIEPGVNDDSVLEAERDTLSWVLEQLRQA